MGRFAILIFWLIVAPSARAADRPPATEKPLAAGRLLVDQLNCTVCHSASQSQVKWLSPKIAPRLDDIGGRVSAEWLARYLASPQDTMPGTTMPDVLHGMPAAERSAAAEALTHYLLSRQLVTFKRILPDRAAVARGDALYHRIGCVACHAPQNETATGNKQLHPDAGSEVLRRAGSNVEKSGPSEYLRTGVVTENPARETRSKFFAPLPNMVEKWSFEGLRRFLLDPLAARPSGRMPSMRLTDGEAADIAQYLLRGTRVPAAAEVAVYRERVRSLEAIDTTEAARTGPIDKLAVDAAIWDRANALRFTSWLRIDKSGDYLFYFTAAGAGRLSIDGKWLAGDDSWETESVDAKIPLHLDPGLHALMLDYVHRGDKPASTNVEWEGPGIAREAVPKSRLQSERGAVPEPPDFVVDAAKANAGRALYDRFNCAVCHEGKVTANRPLTLATLNDARGCLAEMPPPQTPDFQLDPARRHAVQIAIRFLNQSELAAPTAQDRIANTMATFNCYACHSRDGTGGVTPERDRFFTSTSQDLGDEGRIPPRLDGVGDKLLPAWLNAVLTGGAAVRSYMDTRMPQFGKNNIGPLPELLVAIDRKPEKVVAVSDDPNVQREAGRKMAGTQGLSCIVCHRFNGQPAQTLQVIDLITAPTRLNEDWFRRFLRDPNRFHPSTRMPALWPDGKSLLPTLLGGDTTRQFAALWTYLSDGQRARFPEGVGRQNVELLAGGEAVVYRGKLWEAGYRAMAIGYPEQVNAAFDAEEIRLSLLWQGRFLNVGPHWNIQGMGKIRPLGKDVVVFPHGPEFAVLGGANAAWPQAGAKSDGLKFRGYQLDALKRPTLLYSIGKTDAEDFLSALGEGGKSSIKRTIKLTGSPAPNLYFRAASGKLISIDKSGWRFNGQLTIRVPDASKAIVRRSGNDQELLIAVQFQADHGQVEVEYAW